MKKYLKIFFVILFCAGISINTAAQERDTLATVKLESVYLVKPDTLSFDIRLYRNTDEWDKWANGTFQIDFPADENIDMTDIDINYVPGSTDLSLGPVAGQLPVTNYYMTPRIINERISITVVGPEDYLDATYVPVDSGITIGTYRLASKSGRALPDSLQWQQPQFYYQACAYKKETDSVYPENIPIGYANDNYEMDNDETTTVLYSYGEDIPQMILEYFYAEYAGQKLVKFDWKTKSEAYNEGFILWRGIVPLSTGDTSEVIYDHLVARYDGSRPEEANLIGLGTSRTGKEYHYEFDTVAYRGEEYCYLLQYIDFDKEVRDLAYIDPQGTFHERATDCLPIPNSVIVFAEASPNPFSEETTVEYIVDDDVLLTITAYDLLGKKVATLMENQHVPMGKHTITFNAIAEEIASNGLYEIIFVAEPLNDTTVEKSVAIVKVQLIK